VDFIETSENLLKFDNRDFLWKKYKSGLFVTRSWFLRPAPGMRGDIGCYLGFIFGRSLSKTKVVSHGQPRNIRTMPRGHHLRLNTRANARYPNPKTKIAQAQSINHPKNFFLFSIPFSFPERN
jgi:hypothetical protein